MNGDVVHRLGAVLGTVLVLGWLADRAVAVRRGRSVRKRLGALLIPAPVRAGPRRGEVLDTARRWLPLAGTAGAGWALMGGVIGVVVGLAAAAALWRWHAHRSAPGAAAEE
ncbi:hypothetical protein GTW67_19150, partial [Streptomyces sp. SID5910]|nr:hypothetical protein [Streptomyces sp. SID5910]